MTIRDINYLPKQYQKAQKLKINHSYLTEQFSDYSKIFKEIEKIVRKGDYTLGGEVNKFEKNLQHRMGAKHAIGVGNGTDALYLTLKALNIGKGDEVITTPFTFIATVASIATAGATPVFVDVKEDYNIDEDKIESAITKKTKAIMPVHWAGLPCELKKIRKIANKNNLKIIQDSCHAIDSKYYGRNIVEYGDVCTFSMHPLKNLNIWGDGGFILTQKSYLAKKLYLIRNHGLRNRNNCEVFAYNSRLDTIQAAVANYKIKNKLTNITKKRIKNALRLDHLLSNNKNIKILKRNKSIKTVFHLYQINVKKRNKLLKYLISKNIDAKVHYPKPIHLQKAARHLRYQIGDFPVAERLAKTTLSLPVHEFIKEKDLLLMSTYIKKFYLKK